MTRQVMVFWGDDRRALTEVTVPEKDLQTHMQTNHHLLPLSLLGIAGSITASATEVRSPAGRIDLVAVTAAGDVVIVEFKTGPANPDFRHVIGQLIDYGAGLRGTTPAALRDLLAGADPEAGAQFDASFGSGGSAADGLEVLEKNLRTGRFHYVAVAQRFTDQMIEAATYLNDIVTGPVFHAVRLVQYEQPEGASSGQAVQVVEGEVAYTPPAAAPSTKADKLTGAGDLLASITDERYRLALEGFLTRLADLPGAKFGWGTQGCSVRAVIPGRDPLSVAWIYPPGVVGFAGARDVTLGWAEHVDRPLNLSPSSRAALDKYQDAIQRLHPELRGGSLQGGTLSAAVFEARADDAATAIEDVIRGLNGESDRTD